MSKKIVWVLSDDRIGNVNQAIGVANALGYPFVEKKINYNKLAKLPNNIRNSSLLGVDIENSSDLSEPWPDIVIGAGRKTAPISYYIKKNSGKDTKLIHLMWPGRPFNQFDLIAIPEHDSVKNYDNVIKTIGAPNKITSQVLEEAKEKWSDKFSDMPGPKIGLLVGGDNKRGKFTDQLALNLANLVSDLLEKSGGSLLISTSRRTSTSATNTLINNIKPQFYFYDYKSGKENPYLGYLAICDALIVSGDSISMCSEACSTGKPVYIYAPDGLMSSKHKKFHQTLYEKEYAKPLAGDFKPWKYTPLNDTELLADKIKHLQA